MSWSGNGHWITDWAAFEKSPTHTRCCGDAEKLRYNNNVEFNHVVIAGCGKLRGSTSNRIHYYKPNQQLMTLLQNHFPLNARDRIPTDHHDRRNSLTHSKRIIKCFCNAKDSTARSGGGFWSGKWGFPFKKMGHKITEVEIIPQYYMFWGSLQSGFY